MATTRVAFNPWGQLSTDRGTSREVLALDVAVDGDVGRL
jgi:hypothetical protein